MFQDRRLGASYGGSPLEKASLLKKTVSDTSDGSSYESSTQTQVYNVSSRRRN
jgi:hypothetical protein